MTRSQSSEVEATTLRHRARAGQIASRLTAGRRLSSRQVGAGVSGLSERKIGRREKVGRSPQPVKLGEGKNGRVAYVEAEILEWVDVRIAERDRQVAPHSKPERDAEQPGEGLA